MNCPGSIGLIKEFNLPESDEPDYRSLGTSAHAAVYEAMSTGVDAWELVGRTFGKHEVDLDMMNAIQTYIDVCNEIIEKHPGGERLLEQQIDLPDFHPLFFGTTDFAYILAKKLWVRDYKHGEGIAVDVENNPQIMYYAFGILERHPEVTEVDLGIVQPRGFHPDGPARTWPVSAEYIREWAYNKLRPAMERTAFDNDLVAGPHCRFCPAKLICPLMKSLFGAAMRADPKEVVTLSDESLSKSYQYTSVVKFYVKALEDEMYRRLQNGVTGLDAKLVQKKADRVFKPGAETAFRLKYGNKAFTEPKLRTPAQMEQLGQAAKEMVKEYAYTPMTGLTVAALDDKRIGVVMKKPSETFTLPPEDSDA